MKLVLLSFSILLFGFQSIAQNNQTFSTDTVSVVSTRLTQKLHETGRNITVIKASSIQNLPVTTTDELLRYIPGINVQSRGAFGAQSDFRMRGSTFSQVLILIDGMRMNDPLTGHFNSNIPVSPAEIARIEVMRGPSAAMYGPDAVGGVINIVTKTFNKLQNQESVQMQLNTGEFGLVNGRGGFFSKGKKFKASGGLLRNTSDGQFLPGGTRSDFDITTASASAAYKFTNNLELAVRSGYDFRNFNAQYYYTRSEFDQSREEVHGWWNQAQLRHSGDGHQTTFRFAYKWNNDSFLFNPAFPANTHITQYYNAQLMHQRVLNEKFELMFGLQADERSIESTDRGDHRDRHIGVFGILAWKPIDKLNLTGSLRGDYDENYYFELLPQLNAAFTTGNWVFRASGGRSIRAADFTERYISNNLPGPIAGGRNFGNPNLEAERAWSAEVGADFRPLDFITLKSTVFSRWSNNLIDYALTPASEIPNNDKLIDGEEYFFTQNINKSQVSGAEIELWYDQKISEKSLARLGLGYTYVNARSAAETVLKYQGNQERQLVTANAEIQINRFSFSFTGLWKQRDEAVAEAINQRLTPSYQLWNGRLAYDVYKNIFAVNLQVHNIFNEQYSDILGAKMPNRWIMGGFSLKL